MIVQQDLTNRSIAPTQTCNFLLLLGNRRTLLIDDGVALELADQIQRATRLGCARNISPRGTRASVPRFDFLETLPKALVLGQQISSRGSWHDFLQTII
jgi:hypothetical protein